MSRPRLLWPLVCEDCAFVVSRRSIQGLAIHDTAQVMGAGLTYQQRFGDELAFQVAAVTKLTRNLLLAAAIPALTAVHAAAGSGSGGGAGVAGAGVGGADVLAAFAAGAANPAVLASKIPPFLVAFLGMSLLRSVGDIAFATTSAATQTKASTTKADKDWGGWTEDADEDRDREVAGVATRMSTPTGCDASPSNESTGWMDEMRWGRLVGMVGNEIGAKHCLGTAMAAVGLSTSAAVVRGVGIAPFAVGAAGSAVVGGVGLASAVALSVALPLIRGGMGGEGTHGESNCGGGDYGGAPRDQM